MNGSDPKASIRLTSLDGQLTFEPLLTKGKPGPLETSCYRDFYASYGTIDPKALFNPIRRLKQPKDCSYEMKVAYEVRGGPQTLDRLAA